MNVSVALDGMPTLGGWGIFNFARPSRIKKWAAPVGAAMVATGFLAPVGIGLIAAAPVAAGLHASYAGKGSSQQQPPYSPYAGIPPGYQAPAPKRAIPWLPIALGGVAAVIALK